MANPNRMVEIDAVTDQVRWCLVDTLAWRCPRCELQLTMSCDIDRTQDYPILICGRCWNAGRRKIPMQVVTPPAGETE